MFSVVKPCQTPGDDALDCDLTDFSVHGISQARTLAWVAISFSRGSSWPRDRNCNSRASGRFFATEPPGQPFKQSVLKKKNLCIHTLNLCSKYLPSQQPNENAFCINCELKFSRNQTFKFISFKNSQGFFFQHLSFSYNFKRSNMKYNR